MEMFKRTITPDLTGETNFSLARVVAIGGRVEEESSDKNLNIAWTKILKSRKEYKVF